ncbi:hypothetical protein BpHYR1_018305 [Brachionus plicatilis]|uniref:Uncharacterized protein n=1 Tax=Brachionus plicatilis TaxID=10195 RepID=A0A3M7RDC7_BRAPC|nr:hypothetical protein BpHYR1_018305 [Brachionus plicatilis]
MDRFGANQLPTWSAPASLTKGINEIFKSLESDQIGNWEVLESLDSNDFLIIQLKIDFQYLTKEQYLFNVCDLIDFLIM